MLLGVTDFDRECFFMAPIGPADSEIRERSDLIKDLVVARAAKELGLHVVRADDLNTPGQITHQVIEHVLNAKTAVADLTGKNANVFYELAVRHLLALPAALLVEHDELDDLPFDVNQMRTIAYDPDSPRSLDAAARQLTDHIREGLDGAVDSPTTVVLDREALRSGSPLEQTVADVAGKVDGLRQMVGTAWAPSLPTQPINDRLAHDGWYVPGYGGRTGVLLSFAVRRRPDIHRTIRIRFDGVSPVTVPPDVIAGLLLQGVSRSEDQDSEPLDLPPEFHEIRS